MNIYRNTYSDGSRGWFYDSSDAWSNANAQDDPHSLRETAREIRIKSKADLIAILKSLTERQIKYDRPNSPNAAR